jgi:two-component system phosphate regulon sensor histidine kinase PhoR
MSFTRHKIGVKWGAMANQHLDRSWPGGVTAAGARPSWRFAALAIMAALTPLGLVALHAAARGPALLAAAGLATAALALALSQRTRSEPAPVAGGAPPLERGPFSDILEQLADPILLIEGGPREEASSRRFLFANLAARDLLRIQRPGGPLTTAIRAPEVLDAVDDALYDAKPGLAVYELRGPQDRFWQARALPLPRGAGATPMAVLWLRDETELRRSEHTRADFLANASHELRTPLASLTGFIETLRGHARDDEAAREKFLAIMHGQAERMRGLIDDLMSLSRIELGEHIPPSGVVDLALLVPDVLDGLAPLAAERCVRFEPVLPPPGRALAMADRDQMMQVVQNLVENAVKYAGVRGRVVVEVQADLTLSTAAAPTSGLGAHFSLLTPDHAIGRTYVALRVRDFGAGMARGHLPRLTERFYRVEGQKVRERPGTGLGLAIVKHIVNRHRGGLLVESAPDAGAAFTAYFPMAPALAGPSPEPAGLTA